jgi:hypothetical protein
LIVKSFPRQKIHQQMIRKRFLTWISSLNLKDSVIDLSWKYWHWNIVFSFYRMYLMLQLFDVDFFMIHSHLIDFEINQIFWD